MGCVYFVRHGQTIWNVENKICGATDIALTKTGHEQAIETGKKILEEGIRADEILYSPLIRARDTALHISEITGIPAREEPRLTEQNFGSYESTPRDGKDFLRDKAQFVIRYHGGESMLHLAQRIYNLLDEVTASEKTYILSLPPLSELIFCDRTVFYTKCCKFFIGHLVKIRMHHPGDSIVCHQNVCLMVRLLFYLIQQIIDTLCKLQHGFSPFISAGK